MIVESSATINADVWTTGRPAISTVSIPMRRHPKIVYTASPTPLADYIERFTAGHPDRSTVPFRQRPNGLGRTGM